MVLQYLRDVIIIILLTFRPKKGLLKGVSIEIN